MEGKKNKLTGLILGTVLIFVGGWLVYNGLNSVSQPTVTINGNRIDVEIVDTLELQETGLSGRAELKPDTGMLFVYDTPDMRGFWMKDMNFPIDIIWIDEDSVIVDVVENISPSTYPETFTSSSPAQYVLEVNAGYSAEIGASQGTRVVLGI